MVLVIGGGAVSLMIVVSTKLSEWVSLMMDVAVTVILSIRPSDAAGTFNTTITCAANPAGSPMIGVMELIGHPCELLASIWKLSCPVPLFNNVCVYVTKLPEVAVCV